MNTLDEAAKSYAEQAYNESSVLTWEILDDIVNKAFRAGALWMAKQHADEIGEYTEKSFKSGAEFMKEQIIKIIDDRMISNLANEGNSAGGRYYSARMEEDNEIITEVKKL